MRDAIPDQRVPVSVGDIREARLPGLRLHQEVCRQERAPGGEGRREQCGGPGEEGAEDDEPADCERGCPQRTAPVEAPNRETIASPPHMRTMPIHCSGVTCSLKNRRDRNTTATYPMAIMG